MEIHWRNASTIPDHEQLAVEGRLEELARDHRDLIDVWIDVEESNHHRHGGRRVAIRCMARGTELVADGREDTVGAALQKAVDVLEREVRKRRDQLHDRRKRASREAE